MELTGSLYGFYSDKPTSIVFQALEEYSKSINFTFEHGSFLEEQSMFFYKDELMLERHYEIGYNTEIEGEGCFNIEAKKTSLQGIATLFEFEGKSNFDPLDINLAFAEVYYYVLTIPSVKEDNPFSQKIHDKFSNILS